MRGARRAQIQWPDPVLSPRMAPLPFLVSHGVAVWIGCVIAIGLGAACWRRDRGWARAVWAGGIGAGLAVAVLAGAGELAKSRATIANAGDGRRYLGARVAYDLGALDALSLAAALPTSRGAALDELAGRFRDYYVRDADSLARWQRVERIRGGCAGELAMLRAEERIGELAAVAAGCEDDGAAAAALLMLGDYAGAARRGERSGGAEIAALVGTKAWAAAAGGLAAVRRRLHGDVRAQLVARLTCAELYFQKLAGQPDAARTLHDAVGSDASCRVIDALAQPLDRQAAALREAYRAMPEPAGQRTVEVLVWAAGGAPVDPQDGHDRGLEPRALVQLASVDDAVVPPAILAPFARAVRHDADGSLDGALTRFWGAGYLLLRGDLRAAAAQAAAIGDSDAADPVHGLARQAQAFTAALALRAGEPVPDRLDAMVYLDPQLRDAIEAGRGKVDRLHAPLPFPAQNCGSERVAGQIAAMASAAGGDGTPLANLIDRCGIRAELGMGIVFGVWPRIHRDRERLRGQLAVAARDVTATDRGFDVLRRALLRRDLARITGDTDGAAAWQGLLDRHLQVLSDRDVAISLVMLHLL